MRSHRIPVQTLREPNGTLTPFDETTLPFPLTRVFTVQTSRSETRGQHAHRKLNQVLVCLAGEVLVRTTDIGGTQEHVLRPHESALWIPPMVWGEQEYLAEDNILMVLCDDLFEEEEYIRDFDEFQRLIAITGPSKA